MGLIEQENASTNISYFMLWHERIICFTVISGNFFFCSPNGVTVAILCYSVSRNGIYREQFSLTHPMSALNFWSFCLWKDISSPKIVVGEVYSWFRIFAIWISNSAPGIARLVRYTQGTIEWKSKSKSMWSYLMMWLTRCDLSLSSSRIIFSRQTLRQDY